MNPKNSEMSLLENEMVKVKMEIAFTANLQVPQPDM